jgi:hypothetical protein
VGKIFNTPASAPVIKEEKPAEPQPKPKEDDDDDWGAVPSFLRRPKIK